MNTEAVAERLLEDLAIRADSAFAHSTQRYFPSGVAVLGVRNAAVAGLANDYFRERPEVPATTRLLLAEEVLSRATHHEEILLGFALLHKVAKKDLGPELLDHCLRWLETRVSNWAQCDDMCLKLLYPFFLGHLDRIPRTREWIGSESNWARRAANVAVVKFVRRKVGDSTFELPLDHVLDNCVRLMHDEDVYVQKGCGWLLKVAAPVHPEEVAAFLREWSGEMPRVTFRYATEKMDRQTSAALMSLERRRTAE
ncbi:DNA alkylation repair protein [Streptomyces sp. ACA25]|uniref:DNA alkylation repair protein n=1 Tax=Streptomyces sp. ACA25 TaxID=3022596 RepID=UPI002307F668|nr:DNA alkylation repair protein [Streptomyces sp. ACA25]MDB1088296.1 DNA alkylation repair protein [Streptomyces sp. ACA25]